MAQMGAVICQWNKCAQVCVLFSLNIFFMKNFPSVPFFLAT